MAKQVALSQQVVVQEQPQQKQALIPASYPTVELPLRPLSRLICLPKLWLCLRVHRAALEYSTCHAAAARTTSASRTTNDAGLEKAVWTAGSVIHGVGHIRFNQQAAVNQKPGTNSSSRSEQKAF
ncbi:MAG: hypothetical protein R3C11_08255 [Planctomycetaceae bacterium]